jgi:hypothetical protein
VKVPDVAEPTEVFEWLDGTGLHVNAPDRIAELVRAIEAARATVAKRG